MNAYIATIKMVIKEGNLWPKKVYKFIYLHQIINKRYKWLVIPFEVVLINFFSIKIKNSRNKQENDYLHQEDHLNQKDHLHQKDHLKKKWKKKNPILNQYKKNPSLNQYKMDKNKRKVQKTVLLKQNQLNHQNQSNHLYL